MKNILLALSLLLMAQLAHSAIITGTITDDTGEYLIGANVMAYEGETMITGVTTDFDGKYKLDLKPAIYRLQIAYVGYETKWIEKVDLRKKTTKTIDVVMDEGVSLEECVVVCASAPSRSRKSSASRGAVRAEKKSRRAGRKSKGASFVASSAAPPPAPAAYGISSASDDSDDRAFADMDMEGAVEMIAEDELSVIGGEMYALPIVDRDILGKLAETPKTEKAPKPHAGQLTAGEQNTLTRWAKWKAALKDTYKSLIGNWGLSTKERYAVSVLDDNNNPVADVKVVLKSNVGSILWEARTDNEGKAELWNEVVKEKAVGQVSKILIYKNDQKFTIKKPKTFEQKVNIIRLPFNVYDNPCTADIMFVVDATGSMSDEINYLKAEMEDVIDRVQADNESLYLRLGSVFYRDQGDEYVTRKADFSDDIPTTDAFIQAQSANGGGNYPEAVHSALEEAINNVEWSEDAIARIMFLVLDAPPHQFPEVIASMQNSIRKAAALGIRVVPITASGIRQETEFLMKTFAALTNGTYVFITDDSGIGNGHMAPTDSEYDVEMLNDLMVRLINSYTKNNSCEDEQQQAANREKPKTVVEPDSDESSLSAIKFYPNPAQDWVTIELEEDIDELLILNVSAQVVMDKQGVKVGETRINVSDLASGMYVIRFRKGNEVISSKLVVGRK